MPKSASDLWWLFTRQTVCVTEKEHVIDAALLMHNRAFRHLPVVYDETKIVGIISAQDIIDSLHFAILSSSSPDEIRDSLSIPLERIMSLSTIVVEPGDGLSQIVKKIAYHNIGALPVVNEEGMIQGIITLRDLVALVGMNSEPMNVPVSEITNTNLTTIKAGDSFSNAVRLMYEKRIRRLPIKSKDNQLLGVVTNKDLLRYALEISGKIHHHSTRAIDKENFDIPVSSLMTKEVIAISGDDDLRVAASRMMIFGVGGLIVEDVVGGNEKFGLVTERDIIRTLSMKKSIEFLVSAMQYESSNF